MLPSCLRGLKHLATKHSSGLCTRLPRAAQYSVSPIFPHTCRRWLQQPSAAAARKMSSAASASPTPADVGAVPRPTARLAVAQMTSVGDTEANFATCAALAKEAAAGGAQLLCLPEVFSFIGASQAESLAVAQPLSGPLMSRYRALAADSGLWLSLGGFQEEGPDPQHIYNCHVVVDPCGEVVGAYRKIHLFDVDVPQGPVLQESSTTAPGDKLVAVDTPVGRLGLSVCYDLRFPELYQELTWGLGAQLLLVPSAFTQVTGAAHWEVLLRARAIECQAYVVAAAQAGRHNHKRASYGHSLVVDPWGTVVGRLEDPGATGVALVDIDLGQLAAVRAKMPIEAHRAAGRARWAGTAASS